MAKKGGGTRLKRQMAPNFWKIERKHSRFVLKVSPGPHPKSTAYPLGVVLRDILKVCKTMQEAKKIITSSKVKIKGGKVQYGFHDGKTIISDEVMNVGDSCVVSLPELKVSSHIKFEKGCSALITRGENAGVIGKVEDVREGVFSLPKRALLSYGNKSVELPVDIVIPVGSEEPAIKVS